MDPVTADVLSDIAVVAGGVLAGVLVAKITANRSRDLDRERRRLDLCGILLRDIETLRDQGHRQGLGQGLTDWSEAQDRAHSALTQLQIVAPGLERPALEMWQSVQKIVSAAQLREYAGGRDIPAEAQNWQQLDKEYEDAHAAFLTAARRHVG